MKLSLSDVDDLAAGSAFLGTGGGGDPYIGALLCKAALAEHGDVEIKAVEQLADDAQIMCVAAMGAPTVLIEKLMSVEDAEFAAQALETYLGKRADALICAEIGGLNSTMPVALAAHRKLPVVDADGIGRAFPSLEMTSFNINGVAATPLIVVDELGQSFLLHANTVKAAEDLARPVVAAMGAAVTLAGYWMTGRQVKDAAVGGTVSAALRIGRALRRRDERSAVQHLLEALRGIDHYRHAYAVFSGKIVDVARNTTGGWVFGHCDIVSESGETARIEFQNEHLVARAGDRLLAIVPDLISVIDAETARPIPTESIRYGQRVTIVACSAPAQMRTAEALKVVGPAAFKLQGAFQPVEALH